MTRDLFFCYIAAAYAAGLYALAVWASLAPTADAIRLAIGQ